MGQTETYLGTTPLTKAKPGNVFGCSVCVSRAPDRVAMFDCLATTLLLVYSAKEDDNTKASAAHMIGESYQKRCELYSDRSRDQVKEDVISRGVHDGGNSGCIVCHRLSSEETEKMHLLIMKASRVENVLCWVRPT